MICNFPKALPSPPSLPHDTPITTPVGLTLLRFRLFPIRSPLLWEYHSVSFPPGTEMFYFPGFSSLSCDKDTQTLLWVSSLIRRSAGQRLLAPNRSLSQLATSFLVDTNQAIHHKLLSILISNLIFKDQYLCLYSRFRRNSEFLLMIPWYLSSCI